MIMKLLRALAFVLEELIPLREAAEEIRRLALEVKEKSTPMAEEGKRLVEMALERPEEIIDIVEDVWREKRGGARKKILICEGDRRRAVCISVNTVRLRRRGVYVKDLKLDVYEYPYRESKNVIFI